MISNKEEFEKKFPALTMIPREQFLQESKYSNLPKKLPGHFVVTVGLFEKYDSISFPLDNDVEELMRQFNIIYAEQLRMQKLYPYLHLGINDLSLVVRGVWVRNDATLHGKCLHQISNGETEEDLIKYNEQARIILENES
jgi:hypothetical protein